MLRSTKMQSIKGELLLIIYDWLDKLLVDKFLKPFIMTGHSSEMSFFIEVVHR